MKIRSPHNLTNFFFFTGILLQSSLAQQTPDLASQIEGEWIIYRGDNFEINFATKNLLNPTVNYIRQTTQGDIVVTSPNGKDVSNYKKGMNIGLQLKYNF